MSAEPTALMEAFWRHQRAQGNRPPAVYAMVSEGGAQPAGYIRGWSVNRRDVERWIEATPGTWRVELIRPPY